MIAVDAVALAAAAGSLGLAWKRAWLTAAALPAALLVGAAIWWGGGPAPVGLLLWFFVTASALTRVRKKVQDRRRSAAAPDEADRAVEADGRVEAEAVEATGGTRRTALQVLANGGVAAVAGALGAAGVLPASGATAAIAGALAAATADTWASEVGRAVAGTTWLLTTGRRVEPGRSGGVSVAGTMAGLAGAAALGAAWAALGSAPAARILVLAGLAAGAGGMWLDSLLGATLEGRVPGVGNDAVNLVATLAGAVVGWFVAGRGLA